LELSNSVADLEDKTPQHQLPAIRRRETRYCFQNICWLQDEGCNDSSV